MSKNLIIALNAIENKHDVELAVIDDLKKAVQVAGGLSNKWQSEFFKLVNLKNSIQETGTKYIQEFEKAEKAKQKALKQLAELGLSEKNIPEIALVNELKSDIDPVLVNEVLKTVANIKTTR